MTHRGNNDEMNWFVSFTELYGNGTNSDEVLTNNHYHAEAHAAQLISVILMRPGHPYFPAMVALVSPKEAQDLPPLSAVRGDDTSTLHR